MIILDSPSILNDDLTFVYIDLTSATRRAAHYHKCTSSCEDCDHTDDLSEKTSYYIQPCAYCFPPHG